MPSSFGGSGELLASLRHYPRRPGFGLRTMTKQDSRVAGENPETVLRVPSVPWRELESERRTDRRGGQTDRLQSWRDVMSIVLQCHF